MNLSYEEAATMLQNRLLDLDRKIDEGRASVETLVRAIHLSKEFRELQRSKTDNRRFEKKFKIKMGDRFIPIIDPQKENISCPDANKYMTRAECLDYSGSNNGTCQSCENFGITRRLLLPEK